MQFTAEAKHSLKSKPVMWCFHSCSSWVFRIVSQFQLSCVISNVPTDNITLCHEQQGWAGQVSVCNIVVFYFTLWRAKNRLRLIKELWELTSSVWQRYRCVRQVLPGEDCAQNAFPDSCGLSSANSVCWRLSFDCCRFDCYLIDKGRLFF